MAYQDDGSRRWAVQRMGLRLECHDDGFRLTAERTTTSSGACRKAKSSLRPLGGGRMNFRYADRLKPVLLSQLLNALLESQGGWDVHSCERSSYRDKRLPRLGVLQQGLRVGTQCLRHKLDKGVARTFVVPTT